MAETHSGACFCGEVRFEVSGEPNIMGYCHCTDCASWAGAPVNAFSLWPADSVRSGCRGRIARQLCQNAWQPAQVLHQVRWSCVL